MASGRILWQVTGKKIFEEIYVKWQDTLASDRNMASGRKLWQVTVKKIYLRRNLAGGMNIWHVPGIHNSGDYSKKQEQ